MIHQPLGGFQGQATDIEIHAREILDARDRLNASWRRTPARSIDKIGQDTDRDNFMSGEQAIAYGLIDGVLDTRGAVPDGCAPGCRGSRWRSLSGQLVDLQQ